MPLFLFFKSCGGCVSLSANAMSHFTKYAYEQVKLEIFSEKENMDKLDWAMESLKVRERKTKNASISLQTCSD